MTAKYIEEMAVELLPAKVPATVAACNSVTAAWSKGTTKDRLRILLQGLSTSLRAELTGRTLLVITALQQPYYNVRKQSFGQHVFDAFPDMRVDLSEAALCLAFDQTLPAFST